jgi:hypothetical protein
VAIGPAHGYLDDQMQPVKPNVERHLNPAHDPGFHIIQRDLEAGDFHSDISFPSLFSTAPQ